MSTVQRNNGRNGDGWRVVAHVTSALVLAGTAAVAVSSRTIGRPTWWLGPSTNPASPLWLVVPIALVALPVVAHALRHRRAAEIAIACSGGLVLSSLVDLVDNPAVALGFAVVAVAGLVGHVATWAGLRQYR
jgi:hypothetical protein